MSDHGSTALVVEIPEAEPVVAGHRQRFDTSAALGVPAHVTVLYPFVAASAVDDRLIATLTELFAGCPTFAYRFSRTAWFDHEVLFLAPDDPGPFRALTDLAAATFPEYPPYGGVHDEVVPHLTVADEVGDIERMRAVAQDIEARLPITGSAPEVVLLHQTAPGGRWERFTGFALRVGQTA